VSSRGGRPEVEMERSGKRAREVAVAGQGRHFIRGLFEARWMG